MLDQDIATMAYIIVHDYQIEIIGEARAEMKHDGESYYRNIISVILAWAEKEEFSTIARRAKNALDAIDAETFDPDTW